MLFLILSQPFQSLWSKDLPQQPSPKEVTSLSPSTQNSVMANFGQLVDFGQLILAKFGFSVFWPNLLNQKKNNPPNPAHPEDLNPKPGEANNNHFWPGPPRGPDIFQTVWCPNLREPRSMGLLFGAFCCSCLVFWAIDLPARDPPLPKTTMCCIKNTTKVQRNDPP